MSKLRAWVGLALLLSISIVAASGSSYRLAGIIAPENGKALALIELPDGDQGLFRAGDSITDGRIADVTNNTVRLVFPDGELVLQLEGTGNPQSNLPPVYRIDEFSVSEPLPVAKGDLIAVSRLARTAGNIESKELALKMLAHLKLPADARIMAINDKPVASPEEALQKMAASIDSKTASQSEGFQFVISIARQTGNKRVYIMTDDTGRVIERTVPAN